MAWMTSTLHGQPSCSRLQPAAGWWSTGNLQPKTSNNALAAIRHPVSSGCWLVAHWKLAGVDDLCTARAAILHLAQAGCRLVAHRKLAGVDDLYTARAAIRQQAPAGC